MPSQMLLILFIYLDRFVVSVATPFANSPVVALSQG
jgi:hypothetical protein